MLNGVPVPEINKRVEQAIEWNKRTGWDVNYR